jgi:hypothetical protein
VDQVTTVRYPADIRQALAYDSPDSCVMCGSGASKAARQNWSDLCEWWIGQRERWGCETSIDVRRREDGEASSSWFKIKADGRGTSVPIFLIIVQHSLEEAPKQFPHYQLQIPCRGELITVAKRAGLEEEIQALVGKAESDVAPLYVRKKKSISLHEPFTSDALDTVRRSIAELVSGVCSMSWGGG